MFRQSPRRNGRNKGLKIKHVLQISLLLGVSVWLLYQVHHSDDKKSSVLANITDKGLFKLGRKDLRPKDKETHSQDRKKGAEDEQNEVEEFVHDHDREEGEDIKHEQDEENENTEDGEESQDKEHDEEAEEKENGDKGHERSGEKNGNIQKQNIQHEGKYNEDGVVINEENRSEKRGEKEHVNKRNEKGNTKESKKEVHKTNGNEKQSEEERERKDDKQSDNENEEIEGKVNENKSNDENKVVVVEKAEKEGGKKMNPNMKEVGVSSPSDDRDQSVKKESHKGEDVNNNNNNGNKGPSMDQSRSASNQSHSKTNEPNEASDVVSTNAATISEKERKGDVTSITKSDENQYNMVENPLTQLVSKERTTQLISSGNENTSPYSYSVPSLEPKTSKSVKRNSMVSGDEKSDSEAEAEAEEKESNGNVLNNEESESSSSLSILEEEKEVLTDLETLPDSGTGGSINHENAATE